jgi:hypothetical protein
MPEVIDDTSQKRYQLLRDLAFSIYLPLLIIWANAQTTKLPWVLRLQMLLEPGRQPHSFLDPALTLAVGLLWAALAIIVLLGLRILARSSLMRYSLSLFIGMVAIVGFPLAYLYSRRQLGWIAFEVVAILAGACFYFYRGPRLWTLGILVVFILHFGFWMALAWGTGGSGLLLPWPGWDWVPLTRHHPNLLYPLLGLCCALLWAMYSTHPDVREQLSGPSKVGE